MWEERGGGQKGDQEGGSAGPQGCCSLEFTSDPEHFLNFSSMSNSSKTISMYIHTHTDS